MRPVFIFLIFIIAFNVYFYFDIVSDFFFTHGIIKFIKKFLKQVNYRKLHNFLCSVFKSDKVRDFFSKVYNKILNFLK